MLTLILKGTASCNLNCLYCSLGEKPNRDVVTTEMLYNILDYVCRVAIFRKETKITVILHGGEPTLVSPEIYRNAFIKIKKDYPQMDLKISMQTNAFIMSESMLQFIKDFHVNVGVSIDGSAEIHDKERRNVAGQDTFEQVEKNIDLLLREGINVSCLMVLTSIGVKSSFDYLAFYASRGIHLKINPLLNYGEVYNNPGLSLESGQYAEYLIKLYEYIIQNEIDVSVSPLDKFLYSAIGKRKLNECTFDPVCNRKFICIDLYGNIYPCGKFSDIHSFCLGNVMTADVDLSNMNVMRLLQSRRSEKLPEKCRKCKYSGYCNAGCNAETVIEKMWSDPPLLCNDYQKLFQYFEDEGLRYLKRYLIEKKQRLLKGQ